VCLYQCECVWFFDLEFFSRYSALVDFFSGSVIRVGFHTLSLSSRGRLLTHRVYWNPYRHAKDNFLALVQVVGIKADVDPPRLEQMSSQEEKEGLDWLAGQGLEPGRYVVFSPHADTVQRLKAYPMEQWLILADLLYNRTGLHLVCVGSKRDPQWDLMPPITKDHFHNLSGKTSLTTLMVILKNAASMVGVDSGVAHLAAAYDLPELILFGPESPKLYGPINRQAQVLFQGLHCSPCLNLLEGKQSDCQNNVCINQWQARDVADQLLDLMKKQPEELDA